MSDADDLQRSFLPLERLKSAGRGAQRPEYPLEFDPQIVRALEVLDAIALEETEANFRKGIETFRERNAVVVVEEGVRKLVDDPEFPLEYSKDNPSRLVLEKAPISTMALPWGIRRQMDDMRDVTGLDEELATVSPLKFCDVCLNTDPEWVWVADWGKPETTYHEVLAAGHSFWTCCSVCLALVMKNDLVAMSRRSMFNLTFDEKREATRFLVPIHAVMIRCAVKLVPTELYRRGARELQMADALAEVQERLRSRDDDA